MFRVVRTTSDDPGFRSLVGELDETGVKNPEAVALRKSRGYVPIDRFGPYVDMPDSICLSSSLVPRAD